MRVRADGGGQCTASAHVDQQGVLVVAQQEGLLPLAAEWGWPAEGRGGRGEGGGPGGQ